MEISREQDTKQNEWENEPACPYLVESPTESPEKGQAIISMPMSLIALLQKVNLKRKHEEEMESNMEEPEEIRLKWFRMMKEEDSVDGNRREYKQVR